MYSRRGFLSGLIKSAIGGVLGRFAKPSNKEPVVVLTDAQKKQAFMNAMFRKYEGHIVQMPAIGQLPKAQIEEDDVYCQVRKVENLEVCGWTDEVDGPCYQILTPQETASLSSETGIEYDQGAWDQLSDEGFVNFEAELEYPVMASIMADVKTTQVLPGVYRHELSFQNSEGFELVKTSRGDLYLEK